MPWTSGDASRFKRHLSPDGEAKWAEIANRVLQQTNDEGKAIRIANGFTRGAISRRLRQEATRKRGY